MYQVLARKWRPQSFEELVGQQHVARTLANAIQSDRLAHAYIFAGVRGTGKTSAARILAKCLNCEKAPTPTPCNQCTSCREVAEGRSLDVMEVDAASRRGIDDVRELQEVVSYAPVRDHYKVLIIDEVHMLSKEAFNALLKTLEEPPPRVVFVLATTQIQKVLPTVLSRCQVFEFRRVSPKEVAGHLRKICEEERIEISDGSLERIARAGEGSVRDSLSVLERVLAFCGSSITDDDVLRLLGAVRTEVLTELTRAMARRDAAAMLSVLDGLVDEGHDLVHFWSELIAAVRDLLLLRTVPDRTELLARPAEEARALADAAEGLSREDLTRIFQILAELETGLKASSQPRFLFEATLVRLASLGAVRPIEEILASMDTESKPPSNPSVAGGPQEASTKHGAGTESPKAAPAPSKAELVSHLHSALQRMKPMLAAIVSEASEIHVEGHTLVVAFPPGNDAFRRQLEREENAAVLGRCTKEIAGEELEVLISTGEPVARAGGPGHAAAIEGRQDEAEVGEPRAKPAGGQRGAAEPTGGRRAGGDAVKEGLARGAASPGNQRPDLPHHPDRSSLMQRAYSEPGIKKLLQEFGARIVDIRPLGVKSTLEAQAPDANPLEESEEIP